MADIRFLGRILGDVIREQEGKDAFDLIERVRQLWGHSGSSVMPPPARPSTGC